MLWKTQEKHKKIVFFANVFWQAKDRDDLVEPDIFQESEIYIILCYTAL